MRSASSDDLLEAVGDVDDRDARVAKLAHDAEQILHLAAARARRSARRGRGPQVVRDRAGDLDELPLPRAEAGGGPFGRELPPPAGGARNESVPRPSWRSTNRARARSRPSVTLSTMLSSSTSSGCWKTMPRPRALRVLARADLDRLAADPDGALVALDGTDKDLHQGRFPRAVLAEEPVDLPGQHRRDRAVRRA